MDLLFAFKSYIKTKNLFQQKDKLLLAVSGGVDSVVLCELCKLAGYHFAIAHCNFQLRGVESERDENFVADLAKKYDVEIFIKKFDTEKYAEENKLSIQVAARELRYNWFSELMGNKQFAIGNRQKQEELATEATNSQFPIPNSLLTAHHANDNIETLLMNFFKGTGINGLHGILPKQGYIIRPLLFAKKEDISAFAKENNLDFVEDSSNASDKYTRNYFRNQLIPDLIKVFPQVEENLLNNIERFTEIETVYNEAIHLAKQKLLEPKGNELHIPVLKLLKAKPINTILYEIIKDYGFTAHQTTDVVALLKSESGKYVQSATHRVIKNRNWLIIAPNKTVDAENILIEENDKQIKFQHGEITVELFPTQNVKLKTPNSIAQLDAKEIKFPLLLRKWMPGDYFYPLGMQNPTTGRAGKKKLKRFLIDQKLSITQKEKTWVIEMDKKIIWVVGLRIDDRFKINDNTKEIFQITLTVAE